MLFFLLSGLFEKLRVKWLTVHIFAVNQSVLIDVIAESKTSVLTPRVTAMIVSPLHRTAWSAIESERGVLTILSFFIFLFLSLFLGLLLDFGRFGVDLESSRGDWTESWVSLWVYKTLGKLLLAILGLERPRLLSLSSSKGDF